MQRCRIVVTEPWEVGEILSWRPALGELLMVTGDENGGKAFIKLDSAIDFRGTLYEHLVASPRHEGDELASLRVGAKMFCAFIGLTAAQAHAGVQAAEGWRGGLGLIGDLELISLTVPDDRTGAPKSAR